MAFYSTDTSEHTVHDVVHYEIRDGSDGGIVCSIEYLHTLDNGDVIIKRMSIGCGREGSVRIILVSPEGFITTIEYR